MPIEWIKEYEIGVKVIDVQHKNFLNTLNMLYEAIHNTDTDKKTKIVLKKMKEYAEYHFATEEKYFDEFNYKGAKKHKNEHDKFRKKLDYFDEEMKKETNKISFELVDFLEDWLINHVETMDKKYVKCFKEHGLK